MKWAVLPDTDNASAVTEPDLIVMVGGMVATVGVRKSDRCRKRHLQR